MGRFDVFLIKILIRNVSIDQLNLINLPTIQIVKKKMDLFKLILNTLNYGQFKQLEMIFKIFLFLTINKMTTKKLLEFINRKRFLFI